LAYYFLKQMFKCSVFGNLLKFNLLMISSFKSYYFNHLQLLRFALGTNICYLLNVNLKECDCVFCYYWMNSSIYFSRSIWSKVLFMSKLLFLFSITLLYWMCNNKIPCYYFIQSYTFKNILMYYHSIFVLHAYCDIYKSAYSTS
jgi:hypothetical protein